MSDDTVLLLLIGGFLGVALVLVVATVVAAVTGA